MRFPRRSRIALGVALGALAAMGLRAALVRLPRATGEPRQEARGAYHVHSTFSDGRGSLDEIAAAAARAGLDFVILSDHNVLRLDALAVRHGVLIIPATEESTAHGHVIALGANRALSNREKAGDADSLRSIRDLGGVPALAHPLNRREPFKDWAHVREAAAMETLSGDDLWREALHAPFRRGLIWGILEAPFHRALALGQIIRRPDPALARFDELRHGQGLAQLCAIDAHGIPDYATALGLMNMHLDGLQPPLVAGRARRVLEQLAGGQGYCGLDFIAPASGFRFVAEGQPPLTEGMSGPALGRTLAVDLPRLAPPLPAEIHLLRDGQVIASSASATLQLPDPPPGDYRVEVLTPLPGALWDGPLVPWILSNPIRLR